MRHEVDMIHQLAAQATTLRRSTHPDHVEVDVWNLDLERGARPAKGPIT